MSLKEFHIVFITASVLLLLGFAAWGLIQYRELQGALYAAAAVLSSVAAFGLMMYEVYFIKKTRAQGGR